MAVCPLKFYNRDNGEFIDISIGPPKRGLLYEVHIADLHFGSIKPENEYQILKMYFLDKINAMNRIDIISVDGDLFDHKFLAGSDAILYGMKFVADLVDIAKSHNATLILIDGTPSHDAGQLKLFYNYMRDRELDIRIISTIQYQWIKGAKILCIPELHGVDESIYRKYLYEEYCDQVFGHMTFKGAVYNNNVGTGRLFSIEDFLHCRGPIISGHVHIPGCFNSDFYYTGSPIRYKYGEEEPKGFLIVIVDLDNRKYFTHFEEIISYKYTTIELTDIFKDPKDIIDYIIKVKNEQNIDHIRIAFKYIVDGSSQLVLTNYFKSNSGVDLKFMDTASTIMQEAVEKRGSVPESEYNFLTDNNLSDEEKFVKYVNLKEGYDFITVDRLRELLSERI